MNSVTVDQKYWPTTEFGGHRSADRGYRRVAARDEPLARSGGTLPPLVAQPLPVGRATELGIIRALLDDVAGIGGALVVSGQQGTGKTTLLDAAERASSARGMRVVHVNGAEFESDIELAGLHQLLVPLSADFRELPHRARSAIEAVFELGKDGNSNRLVLLNAVFGLLRHVAERVPVMLIVDDVEWFDEASAEVLAFVARRIGGSRIGLLAAMRAGSDCLLERVGLPEIALRQLVTRQTANDKGPILALASRSSMDSGSADPTLRAATAKASGLLYSDGQVDAAHVRLVAAIEESWRRPDHDIPGLVLAWCRHWTSCATPVISGSVPSCGRNFTGSWTFWVM